MSLANTAVVVRQGASNLFIIEVPQSFTSYLDRRRALILSSTAILGAIPKDCFLRWLGFRAYVGMGAVIDYACRSGLLELEVEQISILPKNIMAQRLCWVSEWSAQKRPVIEDNHYHSTVAEWHFTAAVGIKDHAILADDLSRCLEAGIKPSLLVVPQYLPHASAILTSLLSFIKSVRGFRSGLIVPQIVIECADGQREPIVPSSIIRQEGTRTIIKTYENKISFWDIDHNN